jgi:hypothetical protein
MEIITRQKTIEKISRRRDDFLLIEPKKLQTLPYSFRKNNSVSEPPEKNKNRNKFDSLKRVSPFLLLGFFLVGLFPYMFITGLGAIHSAILLLLVFAFLETNLLVFDFAIWNYFQGKKVFRIWLIEIPLTILVIHLLI